MLGFRVDPLYKLKKLLQEIESIFLICQEHPVFGVECEVEEDGGGQPKEEDESVCVEEDSDILESTEEEKDDVIAVNHVEIISILFCVIIM